MVDFSPDWKAHSNHSVTEKRVEKQPFKYCNMKYACRYSA